jgi:hypothetical protein
LWLLPTCCCTHAATGLEQRHHLHRAHVG